MKTRSIVASLALSICAVGISGTSSVHATAAETLKPGAESSAAENLPSANQVIFLDGAKVSEAFRKGAVLVDTGNYMVHASHREAKGMAEVHTEDTDIIYVLEGSANLVTGGTVVAPSTIAPGEIRGPSVINGAARTISKGDVIVVPHGVPHWFESVAGPLNYYVVKVRRQASERSGND